MLFGLFELFGRYPALFALLQQIDESQVEFFSLRDPEPEKGLAWFMLNAFFLAAVVAGVAVGLGIIAGAFRTWLLEKYPDNRFNGSRGEAGTRIKLSD